ncbi:MULTISPECIES: sensor histidine kinase [Thermodesulfovibrio]|jgi:PAS domain S-box-containing protein|uniref:sensor histidine kinase n=1 Tax=Thermodesulfovibrio TaxID=28261 RepID=UPI0026226FDE|nr:ABC transporter substrate binding protein [Thermodesulfovibrio sp.]
MHRCLLSLLLILFLFSSNLYGQTESKKKILILNSYHHGLSWTDNIVKGIKESLKPIESQIEYYIEYMDTKRFYREAYFNRIYRLLKDKYANKKFDLIFVSDNDALFFTMKHYRELFRDTPVVFCGINNFSDSMIHKYRKWFTGVAEETDVAGTIQVALRLHPDTERIYVINDVTTTGLAMKRSLLEVAPRFLRKVQFIMLENPDMRELLSEVEKIPPKSIILLLLVNRDRTGNFFAYEESLDLLYPHTKLPIYSVWDFYLGRGIVGGKLTSAFLQGKKAGELGIQILRGKAPSQIPVVKESPNEFMFDYNELKRFNISLKRLPQESRIINLPESFFIKYRRTLLTIAFGFVFLSFVIVVLTINITKRKKIERELRISEEKYRDLYDNAPDMYHSVDKNGIIIDCNETEAKMLGYKKEEIIGKPITYFMTEESKKAQAEFFPNIHKYSFVQIERDFVRKDGSVFTASLNVYVEVDEKGNFVKTKTIGRDITYRKKIEEELRKSKEALRKLSVYLQNARENERKEIASEIHDELGQSLTALKLSLSWIRKRIDDETLRTKFDESLSIVNALIKEVQNIANRLRPSLIDYLNLQDAIKWQVKEFERNTYINCKLEIVEDKLSLPKEISLPLFRIFQEALTNIARHANASEVFVKMFKSNGSIVLIIKDNGVGIDEEKIKSPDSFGLMAMRERAYSINGTIDIRRAMEGGTEVIISVPLRKNEQKN